MEELRLLSDGDKPYKKSHPDDEAALLSLYVLLRIVSNTCSIVRCCSLPIKQQRRHRHGDGVRGSSRGNNPQPTFLDRPLAEETAEPPVAVIRGCVNGVAVSSSSSAITSGMGTKSFKSSKQSRRRNVYLVPISAVAIGSPPNVYPSSCDRMTTLKPTRLAWW